MTPAAPPDLLSAQLAAKPSVQLSSGPDEVALGDAPADPFAGISHELAGQGWVVVDNFVGADWAAELLEEQQQQLMRGAFRAAGIGRDDGYQLNLQTRGDRILWLEQGNAGPAQGRYLARLEALRMAVNRDLYLGLYASESHAAVYPPGSFYRRHLDGFRQGNLRTLSVILYLNHGWCAHDGGALRIYLDGPNSGEHIDVLPEAGRLVAFLSERFPHEVLTTRRARSSITTWFSRRPLP